MISGPKPEWLGYGSVKPASEGSNPSGPSKSSRPWVGELHKWESNRHFGVLIVIVNPLTGELLRNSVRFPSDVLFPKASRRSESRAIAKKLLLEWARQATGQDLARIRWAPRPTRWAR